MAYEHRDRGYRYGPWSGGPDPLAAPLDVRDAMDQLGRDMLASGNWLIPHIGGALYVDKPPLYFWLLALSFWLTGS